MTDPDLLFTAKIRNLTENELVVFSFVLFLSNYFPSEYDSS